ncbi:hypothetical protein BLNAU_6326 [Blattamonas nauphoetae]|uniref:Mediator complex subunit 14 n=1 Tax=Blattamonas nauphoetae TaxID=2049346 RepID=A0ABQ9Y552_9EUKA|nr:hypothetical protein BLNAU_6326 [Blattamonas nauphoetae]
MDSVPLSTLLDNLSSNYTARLRNVKKSLESHSELTKRDILINFFKINSLLIHKVLGLVKWLTEQTDEQRLQDIALSLVSVPNDLYALHMGHQSLRHPTFNVQLALGGSKHWKDPIFGEIFDSFRGQSVGGAIQRFIQEVTEQSFQYLSTEYNCTYRVGMIKFHFAELFSHSSIPFSIPPQDVNNLIWDYNQLIEKLNRPPSNDDATQSEEPKSLIPPNTSPFVIVHSSLLAYSLTFVMFLLCHQAFPSPTSNLSNLPKRVTLTNENGQQLHAERLLPQFNYSSTTPFVSQEQHLPSFCFNFWKEQRSFYDDLTATMVVRTSVELVKLTCVPLSHTFADLIRLHPSSHALYRHLFLLSFDPPLLPQVSDFLLQSYPTLFQPYAPDSSAQKDSTATVFSFKLPLKSLSIMSLLILSQNIKAFDKLLRLEELLPKSIHIIQSPVFRIIDEEALISTQSSFLISLSPFHTLSISINSENGFYVLHLPDSADKATVTITSNVLNYITTHHHPSSLPSLVYTQKPLQYLSPSHHRNTSTENTSSLLLLFALNAGQIPPSQYQPTADHSSKSALVQLLEHLSFLALLSIFQSACSLLTKASPHKRAVWCWTTNSEIAFSSSLRVAGVDSGEFSFVECLPISLVHTTPQSDHPPHSQAETISHTFFVTFASHPERDTTTRLLFFTSIEEDTGTHLSSTPFFSFDFDPLSPSILREFKTAIVHVYETSNSPAYHSSAEPSSHLLLPASQLFSPRLPLLTDKRLFPSSSFSQSPTQENAVKTHNVLSIGSHGAHALQLTLSHFPTPSFPNS